MPEAEERLAAAAGRVKLTGQIRELLAWLGDGRKLTQTGRVGLADARHLVERLETGDEIDPVVGDRVFTTRSSERLSGLTLIVEWAKAAGLVRVTGGKLVPVRKNAALAGQPLDLVLRLLDAYPKLGKSLFPRSTWRSSFVGDEFTDIGPELLTELLRAQGPCALDDLNDLAYDMIAERYVVSELTPEQRERLRFTVEVDAGIAMAALDALGIVVLSRNTSEVDQHGRADWSKATAELTSLGRYAIRRVRGMAQTGDPVLTIRITLAGTSSPEVWREVVIPAAYTLDRVHLVIQEAMGWQDSHLHVFRIGEREFGWLDPEIELDILDEREYRLGDLVQAGDHVEYEYDFGDGWEHVLAAECASVAVGEESYPACVAGEGACPPEDSGGVCRFADLKRILAGPPSAERDEMRAWAGEDYDPGRFDLAAANAAVAAV
jgi:hypothetical protein